MKKQTIKLNESRLRQMIREMLLKETSYRDLAKIYGYDPDDYGADKSILSMDDDYYYNGEIPFEDDIEKEINNITYDKFVDMVDKMRGSNKWDTLEALIHSNPIFKKWYEKMTKDAEKDVSWRAFERNKKEQLHDFKRDVDYFARHDANLNVHNYPYYDDQPHIDWAGHENPKITESKLRKIIKESIKKTLKESVIKSREFLDASKNVCYGEDEMSFFAANYLRKEFRRFPNIAQAKACAQEMLQREKQRRAEEMSGIRY